MPKIWKFIIIIIILIFNIENIVVNCLPTLSTEIRSVLFINNVTIESSEKNVTIGLLPGTGNDFKWSIYKNGFNYYESDRVSSNVERDSMTFKCVTTYDTARYFFRQRDPLNTGYNIDTSTFNLNVIGNDTETLLLIREPSTIVMSGCSFAKQPIIGWGRNEMLPSWMGKSRGNIEPVLLTQPSNGRRLNFILQFRNITINTEKKETTFNSLSIFGESGKYRIGFIDVDTCEMLKMDLEITIASPLNSIYFECSLAAAMVLIICLISFIISKIAKYKVNNSKGFLSMRLAFQTPMESIYKFKGEAIRFYFKSQRILIFHCIFFAFVGSILYIPVTVKGDNKFSGLYIVAQANWSHSSAYLFLYQVQVLLIFCSLVICYTRFNDERIYLSYDSNHLVTSRTVLLTGLPRSLVNVQMLKDFLQTGYSNGVYALSIVLVKIFSHQDKENDLSGRLEHIYVDPNTDVNQLPTEQVIESTGKAFVTFSCVSDAHLFTNQFSPHKWTKSLIKRITKPVIPEEYRVELGTDKWKVYPAPRVSDILWTKLHNPANFRNQIWTVLQIIGVCCFFIVIVFFSLMFYETQFNIADAFGPIDFGSSDHYLFGLSSYLVYYFTPSVILLGLNNSIPGILKFILMRSNNYVRSSKSRVMLITFIVQSIVIVIFPSTYFLINMSPISMQTEANTFIIPINFFRRGGQFFILFIILFSMVTPFFELTNLSDIVKKILFHRNLRSEDIFSFEPLNLKKQYLNSLLLMMMIALYGPLYPVLYLFVVAYFIVKFYLVKYVCIASKAPIPPSDKYLAVSFQQCLWFILTIVSIFHFYYVQTIKRFDLFFVYIFLVMVAIGKYIPSCSKSLCYSFFDGAILPCFDKTNNQSSTNLSDDGEDDYNENDQDYYDDSTSGEDDNGSQDYEYDDEEDEDDDQVELTTRMYNQQQYGNNNNNTRNRNNQHNQHQQQQHEEDTDEEEEDPNSPAEYYYDEKRGEFVQSRSSSASSKNSGDSNKRVLSRKRTFNDAVDDNDNDDYDGEGNIRFYHGNQSLQQPPPPPTTTTTTTQRTSPQNQRSAAAQLGLLVPPQPSTSPILPLNNDSNNNNNTTIDSSGLHEELINEYLKEPHQEIEMVNQHGKSKLKQKILKIKQSYTQDKGGFLSRFFNRYKLPTPESMTVTTYLSPYFGLDIAQCENIKDIESDYGGDDDEDGSYYDDEEDEDEDEEEDESNSQNQTQTNSRSSTDLEYQEYEEDNDDYSS